MKKIGFNKNWEFTLQNSLDAFNCFGLDKYSDAAGAPARFYDYNNWEKIDLPHDWTLSLQKSKMANPFAGSYPNTRYHRFMEERRSELETVYNIGWYRKQFTLDPMWAGKRIFIEFEGIYRDAIVWVNGVYLDRHASGYTSFAIEITDHVLQGEVNSVAVRVDSEQFEGWWYEGAGIYRNVYLLIGEPIYFQYRKTVVKTELDGRVEASAILVNDTAETVQKEVLWQVVDGNGVEVANAKTAVQIEPYGTQKIEAVMQVASPKLWSTDTPYLYRLTVQVGDEQTQERFGIRSVQFDPNRGFLLNGIPLKLHGACGHQDFGGVGLALTDNLHFYKIKRLKEMGVNAYRSAHNPPSPAFLDACDELGMLVMDETRMFGTSPEAVRQLTDLVERDRNHPSIFIWLLGNEEFSVQNVEWSFRLMEKASRMVKGLDPTRPIAYAGNNGPNFDGANGASEIRGVNYIRNGANDWLDLYHQEHPEQPIVGTEEGSYVLGRGGAVNDLGRGLLDSTGMVTMPWGSTPKGWVKYVEERDFFAGGFMWTGFDYRGEPNPFYYTSHNTYFGAIDTCGMEKPPFYYYKAWWTDEPVLKLTPHWNHKKGERVTVAVMTNCEEITLSLNGKPLETRKIERFDMPLFEIAFEEGVLSVDGLRGGVMLHDELVTSEKTAEVRCSCALKARGEQDTGIYELNAYDSNGRFCPTASGEVEISIENGRIVGVGNGDSASMDYEQKPLEEELRHVEFFQDENGVISSIPEKKRNGLIRRSDWLEFEPKQEGFEDDFRLVARYRTDASQDKTKEFFITLRDVEGYEYVEFERLGGQATVYLNGEWIGDNVLWYGRLTRTSIRPYRFYGQFKEGENQIKLVFTYSESDIPLVSGYVKVGKRMETPWRVKLHYGKARVFVKSKTPELLKLSVKV